MYQDLSSGLKPGTEWSASALSFQGEMTMFKLPAWKFPGSDFLGNCLLPCKTKPGMPNNLIGEMTAC